MVMEWGARDGSAITGCARSIEGQTRASRGGGGEPVRVGGRTATGSGRDVRTAWVLARDERGRLYEIRGAYRGVVASAADCAERAIDDVGGLPGGGVVIVRRGSVQGDRSLAAWQAFRGDEWHGGVAVGSLVPVELPLEERISTPDHLVARCRGAFRMLPGKVVQDPYGRRRAILGVVASLDAASRQRAAQALAPGEPQTGDVDRLAELVAAAIDEADQVRAAPVEPAPVADAPSAA